MFFLLVHGSDMSKHILMPATLFATAVGSYRSLGIGLDQLNYSADSVIVFRLFKHFAPIEQNKPVELRFDCLSTTFQDGDKFSCLSPALNLARRKQEIFDGKEQRVESDSKSLLPMIDLVSGLLRMSLSSALRKNMTRKLTLKK